MVDKYAANGGERGLGGSTLSPHVTEVVGFILTPSPGHACVVPHALSRDCTSGVEFSG